MESKNTETKEKKESTSAGNQSLSKGLKLLEILSKYPNGCPLAQIAKDADINKSTVYRLIQELVSWEYVRQCVTPGNYRLTTKVLELGYRVFSSSNIYNLVAPHLEKLNLYFGETVNFSKLETDHAVLLYKLNPTDSLLKTKTSIGQSMQLYCSAMGKCYIAFWSDKEIQDYWQSHQASIRKITDNTIVNYQDLMDEIKEIRQDMVSYDREENELGITCIACPIFDINDNNEYAISLSATTKKLESLGLDRIKEQMIETAVAISQELGCHDYFKKRR